MSDIDTNSPSSTRRALLGGLTLGAAAIVAETVNSSPAQATQGQAIIAGQDNTTTALTAIRNIGDVAITSLWVGGGASGGAALQATSQVADSPAIWASGGGDGVRAYGGVGNGVYAHGSSNGVYGVTGNSTASGLYGENTGAGYGVAGRSNLANGTGVFGEALGTGGVGLLGYSGAGGTALQVKGKAKFSRSGKKTVPSGATSATVTLAGVTTSSIIIATPQKHVSGYNLSAAVPGNGYFTLWLNKAAPSGGIPVGWFILN